MSRTLARRVEIGGRGELVLANPRVIVHADQHVVLLGDGIHSLGGGDVGRCGDHLRAERLGHLEAALDLSVGEVVAEAVVEGVDLDARFVEFSADVLILGEVDRQPELPERLAVATVAVGRALDVHAPQLARANADLLVAGDGVVERHVAEAVALRADQHAVEDRVDAFVGAQQSGAGREARRGLQESPAIDACHAWNHTNPGARRTVR